MAKIISIIAAVSENLGIGLGNRLLWNIPDDLKRFKKLTTGKCVIMGKRTWESLPVKPLPGRKNIVLTDNPGECFECGITAYSVEEALRLCGDCDEAFIIGGGSVYRQFMPLANRLYITRIHSVTEADTFFPEIPEKEWKVVFSEYHEGTAGIFPSYTYCIYERL
ncbi:MAG TPA: dihydrofolate reductase [Bacteroidales bacterium]|nr:dihydrofolate reductase [Bacteroidales bacterium]HRR92975.1 dihydrofolate reductase [Bacteroidales bacterium]HRT89563.1 dihydrofolate reductase [Bacteroidales bacterium]